MTALEESDHFRFVELRRDYFERLAAYVANLDRNEDFFRRYDQWLREMGRVQNGRVHDTWPNRLEFLTMMSPPGTV